MSPSAVTRFATPNGLLLTTLCLAQFMLILDVVVVNVALPVMQGDLGIAAVDLQWASTAYTLAFGGLLIVAGRAGDVFGRRRLFLLGLALFTGASLLCGAAQAGWQLFAARGLQGIGAAIVSASALALLTTSFPEGSERNRALGIWGAVAAGGAVAGSLLGGLLTDTLGWRAIFLVNVPIGIVVLVVAARIIPRREALTGNRLNVFSAISLTAGLALLTFALTRIDGQGISEGGTLAGIGALIALTLFVALERRHATPLVRFALLRKRNVASANAVAALTAGATAGATFFATLYLQLVLGYSPFEVGLAFAPVTLLIVLVSPRAATLAGWLGVRPLLLLGIACAALGTAYLSLIPTDGSYLRHVFPGLLLVGLGSALFFAPMLIAATSDVSEQDQGLASGLINTAPQLGGALGLALLSTIAAAVAGAGATATGDLVDGYRAGYLGALALFAAASVAALFAPGRQRAARPTMSAAGSGSAPSPSA